MSIRRSSVPRTPLMQCWSSPMLNTVQSSREVLAHALDGRSGGAAGSVAAAIHIAAIQTAGIHMARASSAPPDLCHGAPARSLSPRSPDE